MDLLAGAGWSPDPFGRHEQRFHDGARWTPYVKDGEQHATDEPSGPMVALPPPGALGRSPFGASVIVVRQRAKALELVAEYDLLDAEGTVLGRATQVGQGLARLAVRALTSFDAELTHRVEVVDADGSRVLEVTRRTPATRTYGSGGAGTVVVNDGLGRELGRFRDQWRLTVRPRVDVLGPWTAGSSNPLGTLEAEDWKAWRFRITDLTGREVARIDKSWRGLATELLTTADTFVLRIGDDVPEPLRSLTVAAALSVDLMFKQADHAVGTMAVKAGVAALGGAAWSALTG